LVRHGVDHVIVDALVPAQRRLHEHIAERAQGLADIALVREADRAQSPGHVGVDVRLLAPIDRQHVDGELAAQHGRRKHVAWGNDADIHTGAKLGIQVHCQVDRPVGKPIDRDAATSPPADTDECR